MILYRVFLCSACLLFLGSVGCLRPLPPASSVGARPVEVRTQAQKDEVIVSNVTVKGPTDTFQLPLKNLVVLSPFGRRGRRFHTGIDLRGRRGGGDAVYASRSGMVVMAKRAHGYGNMIVIQHSDGYFSRYAHLKKFLVRKGQRIDALQEIGIVGRTGRATTAHLHFEILTPDHRFVNPSLLIFAKRTTPQPTVSISSGTLQ